MQTFTVSRLCFSVCVLLIFIDCADIFMTLHVQAFVWLRAEVISSFDEGGRLAGKSAVPHEDTVFFQD